MSMAAIRTMVVIGSLLGMLRVAAAQPTAEDADVKAVVEQIKRAESAGDDERVERLSTQWIEREPRSHDAYYWRARARFRRGRVEESVRDFDRLVELNPRREPSLWERGIAQYYAGQYARGAKQFELYQTFDNRDVENSVWRYLCLARSEGVDQARATMLPIEGDRRVPMMEIYQLYRGKKTPDDVLGAARSGEPTAEILAGRLFYAHLYLGLYHEANGQPELAKKYILLAADEKLRTAPGLNSYMWAVARVHADRLARPKRGE